jgi:hypothetical protein
VCVRCFLWNSLVFIPSGGSVLYWSVVVWPFSGSGGGITGGSLKGVKDCVGEYGMVIV